MIYIFSAEWCTACKNLKKVISNNDLDTLFVYLDVEKDELPTHIELSSLPTLVFPDNFVFIGAPSLIKLKELINDHKRTEQLQADQKVEKL